MSFGTRSYEMARRLVGMGHEVHMITSFRGETEQASWFETIESGIHVHWYPVPYSNKMRYASRITAFFRFMVMATRKARSIKADLVFATSTPLTIAIPGVLAARKHKVPFVFEVRDLWPEMPIAIGALKNPALKYLAKTLEQWSYRNSDQIITLSPGMAEGVKNVLGHDENITIIPNSCDLTLFSEERAHEAFLQDYPAFQNRPVLLYAGTIGLVNGVAWLVDLAAALQARHSPLIIIVIGEGREEDRVKDKARDKGVLNNHFFVYPPCSKAEIVHAFQCADMVASVFVDIKEMEANSANKFFDGLAAGKPIVINYGGWQKELLETYNAGLPLPRDTEKASSLLDDFIANPELMKECGRNARVLAETTFDRDTLATQLEDVLSSACR